MRWAMIGCVGLMATPAFAAAQADIGVLTCTLAEHGEKDTNPDSQTRIMHCAFKPAGRGPEETYIGEVKKVGSQTALDGTHVLMWAVRGRSSMKLKPAALAQTYVAKVADGVEAKKESDALVGERDGSLSLHSLSADNGKDAENSVTVVELRIKSSAG